MKTPCYFICILLIYIMQLWCCSLCYVLFGFVSAKAVRQNFFLYKGMCICPEEKGWGRQARSQLARQNSEDSQNLKPQMIWLGLALCLFIVWLVDW